jgi:hypothetical protein
MRGVTRKNSNICILKAECMYLSCGKQRHRLLCSWYYVGNTHPPRHATPRQAMKHQVIHVGVAKPTPRGTEVQNTRRMEQRKRKATDFIRDEHGSNPDTSTGCNEQGSSPEAMQTLLATAGRSTSKQGTELFRNFISKGRFRLGRQNENSISYDCLLTTLKNAHRPNKTSPLSIIFVTQNGHRNPHKIHCLEIRRNCHFTN